MSRKLISAGDQGRSSVLMFFMDIATRHFVSAVFFSVTAHGKIAAGRLEVHGNRSMDLLIVYKDGELAGGDDAEPCSESVEGQ